VTKIRALEVDDVRLRNMSRDMHILEEREGRGKAWENVLPGRKGDRSEEDGVRKKGYTHKLEEREKRLVRDGQREKEQVHKNVHILPGGKREDEKRRK
jgi:hypothetical protein